MVDWGKKVFYRDNLSTSDGANWTIYIGNKGKQLTKGKGKKSDNTDWGGITDQDILDIVIPELKKSAKRKSSVSSTGRRKKFARLG